MNYMNYFINTKDWKITMHVLAFLKQSKVNPISLTRTILLLFSLFVLLSCGEDYKKISSISQIEGFWENDEESFFVDVEKMILVYADSTRLILSTRVYDRSKIIVSSGSVMYYDAHVFINDDGSSIKISKINIKESNTYYKK